MYTIHGIVLIYCNCKKVTEEWISHETFCLTTKTCVRKVILASSLYIV